MSDGRPDEAVAEINKALELDPKLALAHAALGTVFYEQHRLDERDRRNSKRRSRSTPVMRSPTIIWVSCCPTKGRLDEAEAEHRIAIELDPKLANAHNNLGNILREQHKNKEAEAEIRKAIELDPKLAVAHCSLGVVLERAGRIRRGDCSNYVKPSSSTRSSPTPTTPSATS